MDARTAAALRSGLRAWAADEEAVPAAAPPLSDRPRRPGISWRSSSAAVSRTDPWMERNSSRSAAKAADAAWPAHHATRDNQARCPKIALAAAL